MAGKKTIRELELEIEILKIRQQEVEKRYDLLEKTLFSWINNTPTEPSINANTQDTQPKDEESSVKLFEDTNKSSATQLSTKSSSQNISAFTRSIS